MNKQKILWMLKRYPKVFKIVFTVCNYRPFNDRNKDEVRYGISLMKNVDTTSLS